MGVQRSRCDDGPQARRLHACGARRLVLISAPIRRTCFSRTTPLIVGAPNPTLSLEPVARPLADLGLREPSLPPIGRAQLLPVPRWREPSGHFLFCRPGERLHSSSMRRLFTALAAMTFA